MYVPSGGYNLNTVNVGDGIISSALYRPAAPVFVSPAGSKRVYSRDELLTLKDFRSAKTVQNIMVHMPDSIRQGEIIFCKYSIPYSIGVAGFFRRGFFSAYCEI